MVFMRTPDLSSAAERTITPARLKDARDKTGTANRLLRVALSERSPPFTVAIAADSFLSEVGRAI